MRKYLVVTVVLALVSVATPCLAQTIDGQRIGSWSMNPTNSDNMTISGAPPDATVTSVTVRVTGTAAYADLCTFQLRDQASTTHTLATCYDEIEFDHTVSGINAFNGRPANQVWTLWAEGSMTSGENVTAWYLTINYTADPVAPTADFTASATTGTAPLTVNFTDTSTAGTSSITEWAWDFGDPASGEANTSALQNPSHLYASEGTYTVSLTVTTSVDDSTETKTGYITVGAAVGPAASFTAEPTGGTAPLTVDFTDTSTAGTSSITERAWNFGDPTSGEDNVSALQNPSHTYANAGAYTVALEVTTAVGSDVETSVDLITAEPSGPIISDQSPAGVFLGEGDTAELSVDVTGTTGGVTYAWFRSGVGAPLSDGGRISGATTDTLTISDVSLSDHGTAYRLRIEDAAKLVTYSGWFMLYVGADVPVTGTIGLGLVAGVIALAGAATLHRKRR